MRILPIILLLIFCSCSEQTPEPEPVSDKHALLISNWQLLKREVFDNGLLTLTESPDELHNFTFDTYTDGEGIEHQYLPEKLINGNRDTIGVQEDLTIIIEYFAGTDLQLFKVLPNNLLYWEYYDKRQ